MESEQGQHFQSGNEPTKNKDQGKKEVVPGISGIPVIRSNTPRPLSFGAMLAASERTTGDQEETSLTWSVFPSQAPSAPPLPEELDDNETIGNDPASSQAPVPAPPESALTFASESQEFVWLFEYGLEMDGTFLNNPQRLDGAALLYGPAVLKGYTLMFAAATGTQTTPGQIIVTIMPYTEAGAHVWGVLYRIPRRITLRKNNQPSLLDTTHHAGTPHAVMSATTIVVHEIYREREITCGTYILSETARQQLQLLSPEHPGPALPLLQQLATLARKQKLPMTYLAISTATTLTTKQTTNQTPPPVEHNTEPLPVVGEKSATNTIATPASPTSPWLIALATYLLLVLLLVLIFAVAQGLGFGKKVLTPDVTFLGTPWLVLIYGVLGGCISSIVALGRSRRLHQPPLFIIVLWFTRPYIGGTLSLLAYLLCNSGLFAIAGVAEQHSALFPLIGAVAGLCEGWLFARRR